MPLISSPVVPPSVAATVPTHEDRLGLGGAVAFAGTAERDALAETRRKAGMLASVASTGSVYRLEADLVTWTPCPLGNRVITGDDVIEVAVPTTSGVWPLYTLLAGESVSRVTVIVADAWDGAGASLSLDFNGSPGLVMPTAASDLSVGSSYFTVEVFGVFGPGSLTATVDRGAGGTTGTAVVRIHVSK